MILNKWNTEKHDYEKYEIPDEWNVKTISKKLNDIINCPHCGKKIKFGESYTSLEIHTGIGLGYCVCEDCYNEEVKRKYGR